MTILSGNKLFLRPLAVGAGVFLLALLVINIGLQNPYAPSTIQWAVSISLWFLLIGPGIVAAMIILFRRDAFGSLRKASVSFAGAVIIEILMTAIPFTLFFAHDAPNNEPYLQYYATTVTNPVFLSSIAVLCFLVIAARVAAVGVGRISMRRRKGYERSPSTTDR